MANAGADQLVAVGQTVHLDGSKSTDPGGGPLQYQWTIVSKPTGSTATISGATSPLPTFVPDKAGDYTVQMQVTNASSSSTATVLVSTNAVPPVANAGPDQLVVVGATVQMDGSRSVDVDGDPLTYDWSLVSVPAGSAATISDAAAVNPTFIADVAGTYVVKVTVTDSEGHQVDATANVSTTSISPVANAGQGQTVTLGSTVHLDGTKSVDNDGDTLSFVWSLLSKPASSSASLSNANTATPSLVADAAGDYIAQLIVADASSSAASTVRVSTQPVQPIANAGSPQTQPVGTQVQLDASKSADFNGSSLTYRWWFVSKPAQSTAALSSTIISTPKFTPDVAGAYVLAVRVSDGTLTSAPSTVLIVATAPSIKISPTSVGFGSLSIGTTSNSQSIVLTNTGSANLVINSITLGGANFPEFSLSVPSLPVTVTPGNTASVTAVFKPQSGGAKSATVTINDNVTGSPQTVTLSGTGAVPGISVAPMSITFAAQLVNTVSGAQPVTITNNGSADLKVTALTLAGANSTEFSIDAITLPMTIPAGTSAAIGIRSAPTSTGGKSASLSISNNASNTTSVSLSGSGVAPAISISPNSVSFGNVNISASSAPVSIKLWNTGTASLVISNFSITGNNPSEFSVNAPASLTIAPNNTSTISVSFGPQSAGSKTASLVLTDNTSSSPHQIALAGVGTLQGISISPPAIDFLTQLVNTTSPAISVVVSNTSNTALTISSVTLSGTNTGDYTFTPPNGAVNVAPQTSVAFPVSFAPTSTGKKTASLVITYNGPQSPQSVPLQGTGVAPGFNLSANSIGFGDVALNSTGSLLLTVSNIGTANLSITNIALTGQNATEFSFTSPVLPATVSPGNSITLGLTFKPTQATGSKSSTLAFTDNAGGSPQQVLLSGNATAPAVSISPSTLDFGLQGVGVASAAKTVTITNTGSANLNVTSLTLSGANPSEFGISPTTLSPIAAGQSATVNVVFTPSAAGSRSATLTVVSNGGAPQVINLSGTGALPGISVSPLSLSFGSQPANSPVTMPVTVSNTGNANLLLARADITGTDAVEFSVQPVKWPVVVAPQSNATLNVTFTATSGGSKSASLVLTENVGSGTMSLALSANAVAPGIQFSPSSVTFAAQPVNTTSAPTSVFVINNGTGPLVITAIAINGVDAAEFTASAQPLPITVAPSASTTITLTNKPAGTGTRTASLDLTTNVSPGTQSVPLTGTGTAPAIGISPASLDFGNQLVNNNSSPMTVTLTDTGTANLTITSITKSGANAAEFSVSSPFLPSNVLPGNSTTLSISLRPTSLGAKSATLTITDNTAAGTHTINLAGNGVGPAISVAPSTINFNNVVVNSTSSAVPVVVSNPGTANLSVSSVSLSGSNSFEFSISPVTTPINIAPQGQVTINVMAKPVSVGAKSATLNLTSNAGAASVSLSAAGVAPGFSASTTSINFGVVQTNTSSNAVNVVISNPGSAPLVLSTLSFTGTNGGEFKVSASPLPITVQPGATTTLALTLNPTTSGFKSATLAIGDNAGGHSITLSCSASATVPRVALSPNPLTFASQAANTTTSQQVTISNGGNATLSISSFVLSGANASEFSLSALSTSAPAGGSTGVTVFFRPTSAGSKTATLTITDNAPGSPHTLSISGTGIAPAASVTPWTVAFGNQLVGTSSSGMQVGVSNTGSANLSVTSLVVSGSNVADFTVSTPGGLPATVAPGNTLNVTVTFKPGGTGSRSATLTVNDNAPGSPQTAQLTGTGIAPAFSVTPFSLSFGNVNANAKSTLSLTIKNTGTADLVVSSLALSGANMTEYSVGPATPITISAGNSAQVNVTLAPVSTGSKSATLTITHNAGLPQQISLSGVGVAPAFSASPSSVKFADQLQNTTSSPTSVLLSNSGNGPLTITAIQVTGANASDFPMTAPALPVTLNPFANVSVGISFKPSTMGQESATLVVTDSAPNSPHWVALSGKGIGAIFSAAPTSLNFSNQSVNTASPSQPVVVTNKGTASLSITKVAITGTNASDFSVSPSFGSTLSPNASETFNVTFKPGSFGSKTAALTFTDSASDSPQSVALSGMGISAGFNPSPSPMNFGAVLVSTSSTIQLAITNNGNTDLVMTNATLGGTNASEFSMGAMTFPMTVAMNTTVSVPIKFNPVTSGNKSATLTFTDNAGGSPQSVAISGIGAVPMPSVTPGSIFFTTQPANTVSNPTSVTVKNTGTAPLVISSVALQGANSGEFTLSPVSAQTSVAPGASLTFTVSFAPQSAGTKNATVVITDNASPTTQTVSLAGNATGSPITMSAASVGVNMELQAVAALGAAAPSGGTTVTLTSSDATSILLSTSATAVGSSSIQLVVAAGQTLTPAFFVQAVGLPGSSATVSGTAPAYNKGSAVMKVVNAGFVLSSPSGLGKDFSTTTLSKPSTITLTLAQLDASGNVVITGPLRPGASVGLTVTSGTAATGTISGSPATLTGGNTSVTVWFQPAGQGTSLISLATPSGFNQAAANHATATVSQPHIFLNPASVGFGLQVGGAGTLEAPAPAGNSLPVTITSSDTSKVLVSSDISGTTAGSGSVTVNVAGGQSTVQWFLIQSVASSGSATVAASAPGYLLGSATINCTPSGFVLSAPPNGTGQAFTTTTLSPNTTINVMPAQFDVNNNFIGAGVIAGGSTVNVSLSTTGTAGTIVNSPIVFHGNDINKNTAAFHPTAQGTDTISVSNISVAGYSTGPSSQLGVTVTQPHISLSSMTLGQNLQGSQFGSLDAPAPSGGLNVTITSSDPSVLLSTTELGAGSSSVVLTVPARQGVHSQGFPVLWVQALGGSGSSTLTASAPGFVSATAVVTETPAGVVLSGPTGIGTPFNTNTKAPDSSLTVSLVQLDPITMLAGARQELRAGLSLSINVANDNQSVGTMSAPSVTINAGSPTSNSVTFHPVAKGSTVITATPPNSFGAPSDNSNTITATVTF